MVRIILSYFNFRCFSRQLAPRKAVTKFGFALFLSLSRQTLLADYAARRLSSNGASKKEQTEISFQLFLHLSRWIY